VKLVIIIVAVLVLIGGGAYFVTKRNNKPASTPAAQSESTNSNQFSVLTITYSENGFSPESLTVNVGSTVTIVNASSRTLQFESDPHPQHTDDTDLNAGVIAPNKSATIVVSKKGTFGYHNHLNSSQTGTITVQ